MGTPGLDSIKTIVIAMMENRSFDHLVGYLSLPPYKWDIEGVQETTTWLKQASSLYNGVLYPPSPLDDPHRVIAADPPHEWYNIARQMGELINGTYPMNGFVSNYATAKGAPPIAPGDKPPVMGYFTAKDVPITDFFAQHFVTCDHWFSSLPAGTQPNRLMAMAGSTRIAANTFPLPHQYLVYDWLTAHQVRWRVYHEGLPFFAMMLEWLPDVLHGDHFRPFAKFWEDVQNEPPDEFPEVIFVEPGYTDAPHVGVSRDDHAPSAVQGGQQFLLEVYRTLSLQPNIWNESVLIVTYDEHGGFFDHVSPPLVETAPPKDANYTRGFSTLGLRVPSFVISPFVAPGGIYKKELDHTSILRFIAQKFGKGAGYSDLVDSRPVGSILDVLDLDSPRDEIPTAPSLVDYVPTPVGYTPGSAPPSILAEGFKRALDEIRKSPNPSGKFGDLLDSFPPEPSIRTP